MQTINRYQFMRLVDVENEQLKRLADRHAGPFKAYGARNAYTLRQAFHARCVMALNRAGVVLHIAKQIVQSGQFHIDIDADVILQGRAYLFGQVVFERLKIKTPGYFETEGDVGRGMLHVIGPVGDLRGFKMTDPTRYELDLDGAELFQLINLSAVVRDLQAAQVSANVRFAPQELFEGATSWLI